MLIALSQILGTTRIAKFVSEIVDIRQYQVSPWDARIPDVPATEDDIIWKGAGSLAVADVVMDGAMAPTRKLKPSTFVQTKVPNLKHGLDLDQRDLDLLYRLTNGGGLAVDAGSLDTKIAGYLAGLIDGVNKRKAILKCAVVSDGFAIDKFGIKASGVTFGMKADLKVTLTGGQQYINANLATMTPVADALALIRKAKETYGITYDRITYATAVFDVITASDEFKAKAQIFSGVTFGSGSFPLPVGTAKELLQRVLGGGIEIEIDDATYFVENEDGTESTARYVAEADVIFSTKAADGNAGVWDFANCPVTEAIASNLMSGTVIGNSIPAGTRGPVGYVTAANGNMNPPGVTLWAVTKGMSRRHHDAVTAKIICK